MRQVVWVGLVGLCACSLVTGLDDPTSRDASAGDSGGDTDGSVSDAGDGGESLDGASFDAEAGSFAPVQTASTASSTNLMFSSPTRAGSLLLAALATNDFTSDGGEPIASVSDSVNGSWLRAASVQNANGHVELFYFPGSQPGAVVVSESPVGVAFVIAEYAGIATVAPLDRVATNSGVNAAALSAGPTASIAAAGELVVGVAGQSGKISSFGAGAGFVLRDQALEDFTYNVGLEDLEARATSGAVMTMTGNQGAYGAIVAAFKRP